jgi:N utilization substance protein A
LIKGYETLSSLQSLEKAAQFHEDYFNNFDVELDVEEEGFRILSTKTIVEEVTNPDHHIGLKEVQEVAE